MRNFVNVNRPKRFAEISPFSWRASGRTLSFCRKLVVALGLSFLISGLLPFVSASLCAQEKTKVPALMQLLRPLTKGKAKPAADVEKGDEKKREAKKAETNKEQAKKDVAAGAAGEETFEFAAAANVDPFQQQFTIQFRRVFAGEVYFLNQTCNVTPEQRVQVKAASEIVLKDVVKKFVDIQKKMNQGGFDWNSPAPEPRRYMQDGLVEAIKKILSPEQVQFYEMEVSRRQENRKRTTVANVVAQLDDELILTSEQRDKLTSELLEKWKQAESQQLEIFQYGENYFPNVPEQFVLSALNEKQKDIWRGRSRSGNIFFGIGHIGNVVLDEKVWADDSEKPATGEKKPENTDVKRLVQKAAASLIERNADAKLESKTEAQPENAAPEKKAKKTETGKTETGKTEVQKATLQEEPAKTPAVKESQKGTGSE